MAERRDTRLRFEQWARNAACLANTISAVHGVPMAEVVKREGGEPTMGQSPFALARGHTFEQTLFRDDAKLLGEALQGAQVLPASGFYFRDFRLRHAGGPFRALDEAMTATAQFLEVIAGGGELVPTVVAGAVVRIPGGVMLPEAILVIDVLTVTQAHAHSRLTVGEIKTYPDRGGYTDGAELATARAQAGVYVHGLRLVLAELGLTGQVEVADTGFLVLSRPGSNRPSIRAGEDLRYQGIRAERGFAQLRKVAAALPAVAEADTVIDAVLAAPVAYTEACVSFCDRMATCHGRALARGEARVLGEDVARFLGETGLYRALELLEGKPPVNSAEEDLARRMREARRN